MKEARTNAPAPSEKWAIREDPRGFCIVLRGEDLMGWYPTQAAAEEGIRQLEHGAGLPSVFNGLVDLKRPRLLRENAPLAMPKAALSPEIDQGMLVSALAFLAMHHERQRDEGLCDSHNNRFSPAVRADCIRIADHHQKQLHEIGEQIALLGGRNAYPRP